MGDGALSGSNSERASPGVAGYGGPGKVMREVVRASLAGKLMRLK